MKLLIHKDRHVVVAPELDEGASLDGESVSVLWVGVAPNVEGTARRGRPPAYKGTLKALPTKELVALDPSDVSDELVAKAEKVIAEQAPHDDAEESTSVAESVVSDDDSVSN